MLIICASLPAARSFIMHLIRGNKTPTPSYANSSGRMYMRQDDSKAQASHQMKSFGVSTAGGTTLNGESDEDLVDKRSGKWSST